MKIYLGADHRGFFLKGELKSWLISQSYTVEDMGNYANVAGDDYIDFAMTVAKRVSAEDSLVNQTRGILICGSGIGMSMAANKVQGIRAGLGFEEKQVLDGRSHDNINILTLGADVTGVEKAKQLVNVFLKTAFIPEEHYKRRLEKLNRMELTAQ